MAEWLEIKIIFITTLVPVSVCKVVMKIIYLLVILNINTKKVVSSALMEWRLEQCHCFRTS